MLQSIWTIALLGIACGYQAHVTHVQAQQPTGALCWQPNELKSVSREKRIQKKVRAAFVLPPDGRVRPPLPGFRPTDGQVIRRVKLPADKKLVAFTFDLCEQPYEISGYQGDIVDYLRENDVPATFFASGKWLMTHKARAQQILGDPLFEIGNHAWEHRNFRVLTTTAMNKELDGATLAYQRTYDRLKSKACYDRTGLRLAHQNVPQRPILFRFPFGACNAKALHAVNARGMLPIQWDISSADPWTGQTVNGMVRTVMARVRSGSIVLFHANGRGWRTGRAIPILIRRLRSKGYRFVTVSQLLNYPGAKWEVAKTCYDFMPGDTNRYDRLALRLERAYQAFYSRFSND